MSRKRTAIPFLIGLLLLIVAACGPVARGADFADSTPVPQITQDQTAIGEAHVESVEIQIVKAVPMQINATARGNLTEACAELGASQVRYASNVFQITLPTLSPTDRGCAPIITPFESTFVLNTIDLPAGPYTVIINGISAAFTLPAAAEALPAPTVGALPPAAIPAPSSPSQPQAIDGAGSAWKTFVSPSYQYSIAYPPDWKVSVENAGTMDDAIEIERVVFRQPNYGTPNQLSTITIEAAQHGYATEGQCQGQREVIPGIKGCRRSFPKVQNSAQEIVWFQPPLASAIAQPYFDVRLAYDDAGYVATFNQMLASFKYVGAPVTAAPQDRCPQVGAGPSGDSPLDAQPVVPGAATATPMSAWKTYASARHNYVVSYPADWTIDIQTSAPGRYPEYIYLRPAATGLPMVSIFALKDVPPITGFENCSKNLQFRGTMASSISLPKGQNPAAKLLVFQKGDSFYQIGIQYDEPQQLAVFEEIVKSFQFMP